MSLTFKGQYTVKKGNYLIYSKNNIQNNGFSLVRNWFVSDKNQLKLVDLNEAIISQNNITSDSIEDLQVIFRGNKNQFAKITSINDTCFQISLNEQKQIDAIGIDIVYNGVNGQSSPLKHNANLLVSYNNSEDNQNITMKPIDDFPIPVAYSTSIDHSQIIYNFKNSFNTNMIKIAFNPFCQNMISYQIYSINFYTRKKLICPPQRITLYDSNGNVIIHKLIQTKFSDASKNSIIYKVNIQFDQIVDKGFVYAISTDFYNYESNEYQMFSYSQFSEPWEQETLQIIQLQYQLTFGSEIIISSTSSDSASSISNS